MYVVLNNYASKMKTHKDLKPYSEVRDNENIMYRNLEDTAKGRFKERFRGAFTQTRG